MNRTVVFAMQVQPELSQLLTGAGDDDSERFVGKLNFSVDYNLSTAVVRAYFRKLF